MESPTVPRNWKRQRTRPPWSLWRECSKADILILDFWNSDWERINFCHFKPQFVVNCYGNKYKLF